LALVCQRCVDAPTARAESEKKNGRMKKSWPHLNCAIKQWPNKFLLDEVAQAHLQTWLRKKKKVRRAASSYKKKGKVNDEKTKVLKKKQKKNNGGKFSIITTR